MQVEGEGIQSVITFQLLPVLENTGVILQINLNKFRNVKVAMVVNGNYMLYWLSWLGDLSTLNQI